jgi:hypothetical protein
MNVTLARPSKPAVKEMVKEDSAMPRWARWTLFVASFLFVGALLALAALAALWAIAAMKMTLVA